MDISHRFSAYFCIFNFSEGVSNSHTKKLSSLNAFIFSREKFLQELRLRWEKNSFSPHFYIFIFIFISLYSVAKKRRKCFLLLLFCCFPSRLSALYHHFISQKKKLFKTLFFAVHTEIILITWNYPIWSQFFYVFHCFLCIQIWILIIQRNFPHTKPSFFSLARE